LEIRPAWYEATQAARGCFLWTPPYFVPRAYPWSQNNQFLSNPSSIAKGIAITTPSVKVHWCVIPQKHLNMPPQGNLNPHFLQTVDFLRLFKRNSSLFGCVFFFTKKISPLLFGLKEPLFFYHSFYMVSKAALFYFSVRNPG